jgi:uncharacterized protein YktB (UPF0637 family)
MYTEEMSKAFKAIQAPDNFKVTIFDSGDFITMMIDPEDIENLLDNQVDDAVKYINDVKKALEDNGAVVYLVREALKD